MSVEKLVYGKSKMPNVTGMHYEDNVMSVWAEGKESHYHFKPWYVSSHKAGKKLQGSNPLNFMNHRYTNGCYSVGDKKEAFMLTEGVTFYKGMKVEDLKVLSFDIETTSFDPAEGQVLIISWATLDGGKQRTSGRVCYDQFENETDMIKRFESIVQEYDPDVMLAHNGFCFDIPYLISRLGRPLRLGRNDAPIVTPTRPSQFRRDGSQTYEYTNYQIPGREIVDTFYLAIKYDVLRTFSSYGLKSLVKEAGLEEEGRVHYDASQIKNNYKIPEEWAKIKRYAVDDAIDTIKLYQLMIPQFFYLTQMLPMSLQAVINRATGSQINSLMVRAYLQDGLSLPQATEAKEYQGGMSGGNPGVYKNVYKVDVKSMYPSIMREWKIYPKGKDPEGAFLQILDYLTEERLKNKTLGKSSDYHKHLSDAQKMFINSAYGFLGANGLIFNAPDQAARITKIGREILQKGIDWATKWDFNIVNMDTDSFSFTLPRSQPMEDGQFDLMISQLNKFFPEMIEWENDGHYDSVVVVKTKNYALLSNGKLTIKGSALKATMKEPALKEFLKCTLMTMLDGEPNYTEMYYNIYANEIKDIKDMARWCSKKTVTHAVLNPKRTQEVRILEALKGKDLVEGDKVNVFYEREDKLCLLEDFHGQYDRRKLFKKLHDTVKIFANVIDVTAFPNYSLKRNEDYWAR